MIANSDLLVGLLIDASLRAVLLAAFVSAVLWLFRIRTVSVRHRMWTTVAVGMLLMPLLATATPEVPLPNWMRLPDASRDFDELAPSPLAMGGPSAAASAGTIDVLVPSGELPVPIEGGASPVRWVDRATVIVAAMYLIGLAVAAGRLLFAIQGSHRLARNSRLLSMPPNYSRLIGSTQVLESSQVRVPLTIGWWRPAVLLPVEWRAWSDAKLESVLAHEGAHVRRRDTLVTLVVRMNAALYWFHPLAWYLARRLAVLAEQACDDEVIASCGDRVGYAWHLLEIAGQITGKPRRCEVVSVAMAARANVERRITEILDESRPLSRRLTRKQSLIVGAMVVSLTLLAASISASEKTAMAGGADTSIGNAEMRTISGRIVDENGQPLADARVWMEISGLAGGGETMEAAADKDGKFALEVNKKWLKPGASMPLRNVWYYAPGRQMIVVSANSALEGAVIQPNEVKLLPGTGSAFVVLDPSGKPIVGARVEPWHFGTGEIVPERLRELIGRMSDERGRVEIPEMLRGGFRSVQVTADGYGSQNLRLRYSANAPAEQRIQLRAAGRIEGQLISNDAGAVSNRKGYASQWNSQLQPTGEAEFTTDREGKFVIEQFASGPINLSFRNDQAATVLPNVPERLEIRAGETTRVLIPMEPAVIAKGIVRTQADQKPVAGAIVHVQYGSRQHGGYLLTDDHGQFTAQVLPGRVLQNLFMMPNKFGHATEVESVQHIAIPAGVATFELPPIEVAETFEHRGKLINKAGEPLANAFLFAETDNRRYGFTKSDDDGAFSMWLPRSPAMESFTVSPSLDTSPVEASVVKREPLVLQVDL